MLQQRQYLIGSAAPMWLWVLAIVAGGSFVMLVGYMEAYQTKNSSVDADDAKKSSAASASDLSSAAKTLLNQGNSNSTTFDFYSLLPEIEKIIPDLDGDQKTTQKPADNKPIPTLKPQKTPTVVQAKKEKSISVATINNQRSRYFLQAGSFKDFQAAESRRAMLALIGIESEIQKANIPKRGLWHRVRIGPFLSLPDMRRTRKRLKNNDIKSIMLTVTR